jgi:hypothetical protein
LTFYRAVPILAESTTGEYDMTPNNDYLEDLITEEELDAEMREWEDGEEIDPADDFSYEYEGDPGADGDWMDANALASAGWGTDEDYGYYGGDEW